MKTSIKTWLVVGISASLFSCGGGGSNAGSGLKGNIEIDGSSTVYPVTEAVAEEFREVESGVRVTIGVSGTGGGFKKFYRGETEVSNASRPIKDKEKAACEEAGIKYQELTVAYDGLAVLVNPANDWVDHFTVEELKKIWHPDAQDSIMTWNQIRPEWPNEKIRLFGPGIASGTYDYFTESIVGESGKSRGDYTASEDDNVLVQGIAGDKYGLGFFGLAYFEENKDKLRLIGVDNGTGPVSPSMETVKNGTYSPLSRPLFLYVSDKGAAKPEVRSFVEFYIAQAGELCAEVGYIPLPAAEYEKQLKIFREFAGAKEAE